LDFSMDAGVTSDSIGKFEDSGPGDFHQRPAFA
jgi:hypothetical protein